MGSDAAFRGGIGLRRFLVPIFTLFVSVTLPLAAGAQDIQQLLAEHPGALQNASPEQLQKLQRAQGTSEMGPKPGQVTVLSPASASGGAQDETRLERILSNRAGIKLKQFGYAQFGNGQSVSIPQAGAVADSYVLGPGDDIIVTLRGQVNQQFGAEVNRDGQVILPKLPPIPASGRSFGEFKADLEGAVQRAYVATQAYASIGEMRQVSVLVVGEVGSPGARIVNGLTTPVEAILLSGGIKKTGTLRNIELIRGSKIIHIDLYDYLTQNGAAKSIALTTGDRILVPALGRSVAVTGWVRRPGIYELAPGQKEMSVRGLLALAGGQEVRGAYRLSVLRVAQTGEAVMTPAKIDSRVGDSDILYVEPAAEKSVDKATLAGSSALAGRYAVTRNTKLSDIIKAPGALGESSYPLLGIVSRLDPKTYARTLIAFSPIAVLNGRTDLDLRSDDVVRVFTSDEFDSTLRVVRAFANYKAQADLALRSPQAAAMSSFDFNAPVDAGQGAAALALDTRGTVRPAASASGFAARRSGEPVGEEEQREIAALGGQPVARASSATNNETSAGIPSQTAVATTLSSFPQLASELDVTPLVLVNFLTDRIVELSGAVRGPGQYLVGPDVSLADLVAVAGGTQNWADKSGVELTTTEVDQSTGKSVTRRITLPLATGLLANYIVQPRDELRFRQVYAIVNAGQVTLQGQVRYPGQYQISSGEHLSELLVRGGGLTRDAYPYGTVFLRKSAAAIEEAGFQRTASELQDQLVVALARKTATGSEGVSQGAAVTIQGFIKDLRDAKPVGRVSIIADPTQLLAHPSEDILLEPGDVVFIPQRPSAIAVLGRVLQPGSFPFRPNMTVEDYVREAGGFAQYANESQTFVVLPDGTARQYSHSWLNFDEPSLPPGSSIVVPRDLTPLDFESLLLETTQIVSQLAVSAASLAVLSKQ